MKKLLQALCAIPLLMTTSSLAMDQHKNRYNFIPGCRTYIEKDGQKYRDGDETLDNYPFPFFPESLSGYTRHDSFGNQIFHQDSDAFFISEEEVRKIAARCEEEIKKSHSVQRKISSIFACDSMGNSLRIYCYIKNKKVNASIEDGFAGIFQNN